MTRTTYYQRDDILFLNEDDAEDGTGRWYEGARVARACLWKIAAKEGRKKMPGSFVAM